MKAIILAAGRGSRMGVLTKDCPKGLISLGGKSLLSLQKKALLMAGIQEVAVVSGYRREQTSIYADREFLNPHWETTGIFHSLSCASSLLRTSPCIVSYSDIFYTGKTVQNLSQNTADIAISFDPDWLCLWKDRFENPLSDAETFMRDDKGFLADIGQKTNDLSLIQGQYMGLLKITPAGWERIEQYMLCRSNTNTDMTTMLQGLINAGEKIGCTQVDGLWGEIDSPSDLALYESWISSGRLNI